MSSSAARDTQESDSKVEQTPAGVIANVINEGRKKEIDSQRKTYITNFAKGCEELRKSDFDFATSPWGNGWVTFQSFSKKDYRTYTVCRTPWLESEMNNQIAMFHDAGFIIEKEAGLLIIQNPNLINFYENATELQTLHGWPHSANRGLDFILKAIDECNRLGVGCVNIDGLDGDNYKKVCERVSSDGYRLSNKKNSKRIIAINDLGDVRLTITINTNRQKFS